MFQKLNSLISEIRPWMGSEIYEDHFNAGLTNIETEIKRLAQLTTIENIRFHVKDFTDILVYSSIEDDYETLFNIHKTLLTTRINALLEQFSDVTKPTRARRLAFTPESNPMSKQKAVSGDDEVIPVRQPTIFLNSSKASSSNSSRKHFLETSTFLSLIDEQRQNMQAIFIDINTMLEAENSEGITNIGPIFAEQILNILDTTKNPNDAYSIFTYRMLEIQNQAKIDNDALLNSFIDFFKESYLFREKMSNSSNAAAYSSSSSSSSSNYSSAASAGIAFYRSESLAGKSKNIVMSTIQGLEQSIFNAWIKPLRDLLDIYAPPINQIVIEMTYSARYLKHFIHQMESIYNKNLNISVSDLEDLIGNIHFNFHNGLPGELDSVISDAIDLFKLQGEDGVIHGMTSSYF